MNEHELKLRALEVQSEHAFIIAAIDGTILDWEGAAAKIFGYSRDEIVGRKLEVLFTREDVQRGEPANELASAQSYGKGEDDRWTLRKDGSRFWAAGAVTPILDDRGDTCAFVKLLRDRTDIRAQLDTLRNRLGAVDRAESHRNVFLATLAHELRNPLFAISASTRILEKTSTSQPDANSVAVIGRQLGFISKLIGDLADVARAAEGKPRLDMQDVDLRTIVDRALETCAPVLAEKRQNVDVLASSPIQLEADPARLQQILLVNLIANASKFSPPDAKIWMKATVEGSEVVLRVQDKGIGVPPEFLPQMFDLFTQAELPDRRVAQQGMGLGLPLVKSIVELHHGSIQAISQGLDKGTEITLHLPLRQPIA